MKTIFSSKTIWFGIIQIVYAIVGISFSFIDTDTFFTLLTTGIATLGLRTVTKNPII